MKIALPAALGHDRSDKRIAILRAIGAVGSISQAARQVGISYKAAWQAIDTLTTLAGCVLVERAVGGTGGGGGVLTAAAHELLSASDAMALARTAVLGQRTGGPSVGPFGSEAHAALARLSVQTSMRNQLPCVVQSVEIQGSLARVTVALESLQAPGQNVLNALNLTALITRESAELLGLARGLPVLAMCKATAVRVERAAEHASSVYAGSNCLLAKAVRVQRGSLGDEVAAQLTCAGRGIPIQMVGFGAAVSGLRRGSPVTLRLEQNALVLALAHG